MNEELKENLLVLCDQIENSLFMAEGPMSKALPDSTHKEGLIGTLKEVKDHLTEIANKL